MSFWRGPQDLIQDSRFSAVRFHETLKILFTHNSTFRYGIRYPSFVVSAPRKFSFEFRAPPDPLYLYVGPGGDRPSNAPYSREVLERKEQTDDDH